MVDQARRVEAVQTEETENEDAQHRSRLLVDAIPSDSAASLTLPGSEGGLVDADGVGVVMGGDEGSTAPVFFATAISMLGPLMFGFSLG